MKFQVMLGVLVGTSLVLGCGGGGSPAASNPPPAGGQKKMTKGKGGEAPLAVPADWVPFEDKVKQYGFKVPANTEYATRKVKGPFGEEELFVGKLPEPHSGLIYVTTYRDKKLSKQDLQNDAKAIIEETGSNNVAVSACTDVNDVFAVCDVAFDDKDGGGQGCVTVGVDQNDNYIMIVASPKKDFGKNKDTLNAICENFYLF